VVNRVLVVDCDVHQGDGTAQFGSFGNRFFTLSIHCESNYPHPKVARSTYDIGLPDGCSDEEYLQTLRDSVTAAFEEVQPDLVLYDAGVDIYKDDPLGRLLVTEDGIRQRDRWVLDTCVTKGIPVAAVIGGGYYSKHKHKDKDEGTDALARRHAIVHEEAAYVWRKHKLWER